MILFPILVPLFIAGTKATGQLLHDATRVQDAWFWIRFLLAYDMVFVVVSLWTFESVVVE